MEEKRRCQCCTAVDDLANVRSRLHTRIFVSGSGRGEEGHVRSHLVERVEDEGVAPHGDGDGVIAEGQAVGGDEQAF